MFTKSWHQSLDTIFYRGSSHSSVILYIFFGGCICSDRISYTAKEILSQANYLFLSITCPMPRGGRDCKVICHILIWYLGALLFSPFAVVPFQGDYHTCCKGMYDKLHPRMLGPAGCYDTIGSRCSFLYLIVFRSTHCVLTCGYKIDERTT
jgi:hypothetical protein